VITVTVLPLAGLVRAAARRWLGIGRLHAGAFELSRPSCFSGPAEFPATLPCAMAHRVSRRLCHHSARPSHAASGIASIEGVEAALPRLDLSTPLFRVTKHAPLPFHFGSRHPGRNRWANGGRSLRSLWRQFVAETLSRPWRRLEAVRSERRPWADPAVQPPRLWITSA